MLITIKFKDGEKKYFDDCSEPVIKKSNFFMIINNLKDDLELVVNLNHVEYFILDRSEHDAE